MAKITTRPFLVDEDLIHINDWLIARLLPAIDKHGVPQIGLIAEERKHPVAAAFIRRCEGNVGMLDGLVTNPCSDSSVRHESIDLLVERLMTISKTIGLKKLFAFSIDGGIVKRSEKHGFKTTNFVVISKTL